MNTTVTLSDIEIVNISHSDVGVPLISGKVHFSIGGSPEPLHVTMHFADTSIDDGVQEAFSGLQEYAEDFVKAVTTARAEFQSSQ